MSCSIHEATLAHRTGGSPSDLQVVARCFGLERTTSIKTNKTNLAFWDESLHWTNIQLSTSAWNLGVLEFELQSANPYWRNENLGMCSIQLRLVRSMNDRCFVGRLPLTVPNSVRVLGHLSVTVNVYESVRVDGGNSTQISSVSLEPEANDGKLLQIPPLLSPLVYKNAKLEETSEEYKYYHLYINVYTLEHVEVGFLGLCPYITVDYGSCHLQSSKPVQSRETAEMPKQKKLTDKITSLIFGAEESKKERCNFTFNQCFLIPIRTTVGKPVLEDNIIVRIWMGVEIDPTLSISEKTPITPKLLAYGIFSLAKLRSRRQEPRWFNFYENADSSKCNIAQAKDTMGSIFNEMDARGSKYIGRIMMSASVKRLSKAGDLLGAHALSSHHLEPPVANPTRLFCDVYYIESSTTFGFEGDFEVMLEVGCGPYETASGWFPAQRRGGENEMESDEASFFGSSAKKSLTKESKHGWRISIDSINGKLPPLDFLVSYLPEQQWLVFIRVRARGTIQGRKQSIVIGLTSFTFQSIPELSTKVQSMPFWVALACPIVPKLPDSNADSMIPDPAVIIDKVSSIKPMEIVDQVIAMDPTGLIEIAASKANEIFELSNENGEANKASTYDPISQSSAAKEDVVAVKQSQERKSLQARLSDNKKGARLVVKEPDPGPTPGDTCDPGATVNVLLNMQKHSFYSEMSSSASVGHDLKRTSHPRRVSMLRNEVELRCYIYCAKLGCSPKGGLAVTVACESNFVKTQLQRKFTCFPVFAECCTLNIAVPSISSGGIASPIPVTISLVFFDHKNRLVRCESAVTTYQRFVKSASGYGEYKAPSPVWLQLSGGSEVLLFTELVARNEASKVPKHQLSPLMTKCNAKLGLIGMRNITLPEGYKLDGIYVKVFTQSYGVYVDHEQATEKVYRVGDSQWFRGGHHHFDLFAVVHCTFDIPQDSLFDPHIEFICRATSQGTLGPVIGYQCFKCYPGITLVENGCRALDLRTSLKPYKVTRKLAELALSSSQTIFMLQDSESNNSYGKVNDGVPDEIRVFESSKEYSRLLRSMDTEHIGVQVPSRFVVACDGREVPGKAVADYFTVTSDILDGLLPDIPYSICSIALSSLGNDRRNGEGTSRANVSRKGSSYIGNSKSSKGNGTDSAMAAVAGYDTSIATTKTPIMKYFLTIQHGSNGDPYRSYADAVAKLATNADKMQRAFRGALQNRMYKLRFCVVSANNLVPDFETLGELYLVVGIGTSESREPLLCESGAIHKVIHRTWEADVFLPEDSCVSLSVVNSTSAFDGSLEDEVITSAQIDLENRWYSKCWQRMMREDTLPIERIVLRDRHNNIHGSLDVIVQLGPLDLFSTLKPLTFNKTSHSVTEVRVVIWSTKGVRLPTTAVDAKKKDQLDLYVVSRLDCQGYRGEHPKEQITDTHYNCDSGNGKFNWRVLYPNIHSPLGACQLQLAVYDYWKVGPPVFVGEVNMELKHYIGVVSMSSNRVQVSGDLPLVNYSTPLPVGSIYITLQVITQTESSCTPAGLGRDEPNCKPFLPTPQTGRQWQDWFAHTVVGFDFKALSIYIKIVSCVLLLFWLFFIAFIYPALLM